jgi:apolipoprotein N-acyltransferase
MSAPADGRRVPPTLTALLGGLCLAAATPPWGFWPLAFGGIVLLDHAIAGARGIVRLGRAWVVWAALLFPSLWWMQDLTAPGYVVACVFYAGILATGTMLAPEGPGRFVALGGGVILAEWVRFRWPFGGVPLSNLAIGQVAGPLAPMLRVGGALFVVGMTVVAGAAVSAALRRCWVLAAGLAALTAVVLVSSLLAPDGSATGTTLDVALVQGGGPQGTRAVDTEEGIVLERHLAASEELEGPVDLVLWPEDVVDVATFADSDEEEQLRDLARANDATFVAGVIADDGPDRFRNWAVVFGPDGEEVGRYEKVERVPFGEWVPLRSVLEPLAGDALPARDAAVGDGPAAVDTPVGNLGISISWEIFFGERARDAVRAGGEIIVNPTNGASFSGTQVQTQQVASSRMRAIETGRWVLQIAPTGFSAVVDPAGDVRQRTSVSEREVLYDTVGLRRGRTIYVRYGDAPALALAALLLAAGWLIRSRSARSPDPR